MTSVATATHVLPDTEALAIAAADWLAGLAAASTGRFAVCLSGGSTPLRLYELLAAEPHRSRLPWRRTHWFWGDERFVPPDHPDSNSGVARKLLLERVPVPPGSIHAIPTTLPDPADAAARYAEELKAFYGSAALDPARPLFDATLLGLGEDGHTASLFPRSPALDERHAWTAIDLRSRPEPRITLTFPVLESSRQVAFLAAGASKRAAIAAIRRGAHLPAGRLRPRGALHWVLDRQADGG
jgi:6-phosphogluconolactonase